MYVCMVCMYLITHTTTPRFSFSDGVKAAGTVLPLVSTVVAADTDSFLSESLDRSRYRASQTPQAFWHSTIRTAYEKVGSGM